MKLGGSVNMQSSPHSQVRGMAVTVVCCYLQLERASYDFRLPRSEAGKYVILSASVVTHYGRLEWGGGGGHEDCLRCLRGDKGFPTDMLTS